MRNHHTSRNYTYYENARRLIWSLGSLLFRITPRPCFAMRRWILKIFGAKIGVGVRTYPSTYVYFPWNLEVGNYTSFGEWVLVYNLGKVSIGERTTISQRVHLCAGTHDYTLPSMPLMKLPITIHDDVWVCADAFVGPNVSIGNRAIVAARGVVMKDIECDSIVGGNPAKFIKRRTHAESIHASRGHS